MANRRVGGTGASKCHLLHRRSVRISFFSIVRDSKTNDVYVQSCTLAFEHRLVSHWLVFFVDELDVTVAYRLSQIGVLPFDLLQAPWPLLLRVAASQRLWRRSRHPTWIKSSQPLWNRSCRCAACLRPHERDKQMSTDNLIAEVASTKLSWTG